MEDRSWERMQAYADELPLAYRYCTDELAVYGEVLWPPNPQGGPSSYVISYGKDETYTIEGVNADLRTYLGRLKRRSRCFSRCIQALRRALRLFVWYYNKRQRTYNANSHLKGNLCLLY
jgi:insertion element IS1 protein InsB